MRLEHTAQLGKRLILVTEQAKRCQAERNSDMSTCKRQLMGIGDDMLHNSIGKGRDVYKRQVMCCVPLRAIVATPP